MTRERRPGIPVVLAVGACSEIARGRATCAVAESMCLRVQEILELTQGRSRAAQNHAGARGRLRASGWDRLEKIIRRSVEIDIDRTLAWEDYPDRARTRKDIPHESALLGLAAQNKPCARTSWPPWNASWTAGVHPRSRKWKEFRGRGGSVGRGETPLGVSSGDRPGAVAYGARRGPRRRGGDDPTRSSATAGAVRHEWRRSPLFVDIDPRRSTSTSRGWPSAHGQNQSHHPRPSHKPMRRHGACCRWRRGPEHPRHRGRGPNHRRRAATLLANSRRVRGRGGVFLVFPSKNLGAFGDAGARLTARRRPGGKAQDLPRARLHPSITTKWVGGNLQIDACRWRSTTIKLPPARLDERRGRERRARYQVLCSRRRGWKKSRVVTLGSPAARHLQPVRDPGTPARRMAFD